MPARVFGTENLTDLRRYLEDLVHPETGDPELLEWMTATGVPAARFVDILAARSAGVWIYLRYVLDEIRTGKRPVTGPHGLNGLPQGLDDYYTQQLDRWRTAPDWATVRLPAVATLTALRRPVTVAELASDTRHAAPADLAALQAWLREGLRAFLDDQDAASQYDALTAAGCDQVYVDKASSRSAAGTRPQVAVQTRRIGGRTLPTSDSSTSRGQPKRPLLSDLLIEAHPSGTTRPE